MGLPLFRFTLSHQIAGTIQCSEPDGWKDAKLKLERHPDFHSLVEYFEAGFIHYGENNVDIGGADFIRSIESTYGFNADIVEQADVSFDGFSYENIFTGLKDLTGLQEIPDNKIEVPTIPISLWSTFIARLETPVDIRSTTDIDGRPCVPVEPIDINLPSQKVRQVYEAHHDMDITVQYTIPDFQYGQIDFSNVILDEIKEKSNLPLSENSERPFDLFMTEYAGTYNFDIALYTFSGPIIGSNATDSNLEVRLQVNDEAAIVLTQIGQSGGTDSWTKHVYNAPLDLNKGDLIRLYFYNNDVTGASYQFSLYANVFHDSYMIVTADTIYPSSDCKGFFLHDVFAGIIQRICGVNAFYSEVLGRIDTNVTQYASNGCYSGFALLKGLQIRGYLLEDKKFSISFQEAWKGAEPIFNLSLGRETISSNERIVIRKKSEVYDPTSYSVSVENIKSIVREYDSSRIFNTIQVGYSKWGSDNISGIDDPQAKREWAAVVGKRSKTKLSLLSGFIAAGLAIEVTRRQTLVKTKDYKYDDDTFILALNGDDVSPDRYRPELDENFNSITGLLNSHTRYNTILSPVRNLLRWGNYWNGCLQKYQTSILKFVSGEGNYSMVSDYNCTTGQICLGMICDPISESADINLSVYGHGIGYLHLPMLYTVEIINFSWDDYVAIRNNPTKAIAVSQSDTNLKRFFIKDLTYEICKSKCKIVMWPYEDAPIRVIDTNPPEL